MKTEPRLLVGIDFSKRRADLAVLHSNGAPLESHRAFSNSYLGYQQAREWLLETLKANEMESLDIAGEATSYYWLPYYLNLFQDEALAAYQPSLFLLNPRWVKWYKRSLPPDNKDDFTDPHYIADRIRFHRPRSAWQPDERWLKLRFYTRTRKHLVESLTREKNLFQMYLFLAYCGYSHQPPFSRTLSVTSQELLRQPDLLESLGELPVEELASLLYELSGHHLRTPLENAHKLQQALADSFPLDPVLSEPIQRVLELLMDTIAGLNHQVARLEGWIRELVETGDYPEVAWLDSVPGVGITTACGILAEIGSRERFTQVEKWDKKRKCYRARTNSEIEDAIGKFAGLWWPKNDSGDFVSEERHMSKEGNAYLRYYLLEATDSLRRYIPRYAQYYQKKYDQTSKHKHKRALVLTARKVLGLFVSLLLHQETYRAEEVNN